MISSTSHEKFAFHGIKGVMKQLSSRTILVRQYKNQVLSAEAVYQFCCKTRKKDTCLIKICTFNLRFFI